MTQFNETELTEAVVKSFDNTPDTRAKFLLQELVKSLHDYVSKTGLTFEEWEYAIDFLTRTGQKCTDTRQEFILLSDVLGVSMLVDAVNHRDREGATQTTVLGPFYVGEHKVTAHGTDISPNNLSGERMFVQSRVTDLKGKPLASVAFMMLVEDGLVAIDEPVAKYIPEWKDLGVFVAGTSPNFLTRPPTRPMLIVDLLRHTSGLTYGFQQRSNVDAADRKSVV